MVTNFFYGESAPELLYAISSFSISTRLCGKTSVTYPLLPTWGITGSGSSEAGEVLWLHLTAIEVIFLVTLADIGRIHSTQYFEVRITATTVSALPVSSSYLPTSSVGQLVLIQPTMRRGKALSLLLKATEWCWAVARWGVPAEEGGKDRYLWQKGDNSQMHCNYKYTIVSTLH